MSNRIVPGVYRNIVNDVVKNVSEDFEEYGIDQNVLQTLQRKWEQKLIETRVADFSRIAMAHGPGAIPLNGAARMSTGSPTSTAQSLANSSPPTGASAFGYNMAGPSGSHLNGLGNIPGPSSHALDYTQHQGLALPGQRNILLPGFGNGYDQMKIKQDPDDILRMRGGASNEDVKPYIREDKPEPNAAGLLPGDEVIDSDLDDSDDELQNEEGDDGAWDGDIVFCVWDKVQRVKNKWKTTFKDGMIHINGKDYLFAKCTGEFEW